MHKSQYSNSDQKNTRTSSYALLCRDFGCILLLRYVARKMCNKKDLSDDTTVFPGRRQRKAIAGIYENDKRNLNINTFSSRTCNNYNGMKRNDRPMSTTYIIGVNLLHSKLTMLCEWVYWGYAEKRKNISGHWIWNQQREWTLIWIRTLNVHISSSFVSFDGMGSVRREVINIFVDSILAEQNSVALSKSILFLE